MYIILLITTAHRRRSTSLAVADKGISKSLTICCNLQYWGLVCYEATRLMWSPKSCVAAAQCCCAHVVHWKVKVPSSLTDVWQQLFQQQDITKICTIHFHPGLHKNQTSAPERAWRHWLKPTCRNMFIRNQWGMSSMNWSSDWLKHGQQLATFIDQVIDQWQGSFNACFKANSNVWKLFKHLARCISP